ncbi:MAG: phosphate ABC transporter permease PstA [Phycisphaerae bacterium]|nr:phosphate ABC transporter permease PstA [Phycisphaerae bacterium]
MSAAPAPPRAAEFDNSITAFDQRLAQRRMWGVVFALLCAALTLLALMVLAVLLTQIAEQGWPRLSTKLLTRFPSRLFPEEAGIKSALWGTIWLIGLTSVISVTVGLGAAIYLEEFAPRNRLTDFIQLNLANLAGVPSIVYGILGLVVFVRTLRMNYSILAGACTLSLVVLPVIIIASREAISAVPNSIRLAAFAVGSTRWQAAWHHVLPMALPGILTGVILSISRAIGETAPLIMVGALSFVQFVPGRSVAPPSVDTSLTWLGQVVGDKYTALPHQVYTWAQDSRPAFQELAASTIVVLLIILLSLNALATFIRARYTPRL